MNRCTWRKDKRLECVDTVCDCSIGVVKGVGGIKKDENKKSKKGKIKKQIMKWVKGVRVEKKSCTVVK